MTEFALSFQCQGEGLVGILHKPEQARPRGVIFVVGGGPQYRSGGHRQLTLWSRKLCSEGYAAFRFDYRGMGDAQGQFVGFEGISDDIAAAIDRFFEAVPEMKEVVLWGECDAASAILFYAHRDQRVKGIVLLNPWVRTEAGEAKAILRFYYLQRLMQPRRRRLAECTTSRWRDRIDRTKMCAPRPQQERAWSDVASENAACGKSSCPMPTSCGRTRCGASMT